MPNTIIKAEAGNSQGHGLSLERKRGNQGRRVLVEGKTMLLMHGPKKEAQLQ
jgi:hypothetical protein